MKKRFFYLIGETVENLCFSMKVICGNMPVRLRIITVLSLFILFAITNIFITCKGISSIFDDNTKYNFLKIKHIENLELLKKDSINNQINNFFYENK